VFLSLCYVVVRRILQLAFLRVRSNDFKEYVRVRGCARRTDGVRSNRRNTALAITNGATRSSPRFRSVADLNVPPHLTSGHNSSTQVTREIGGHVSSQV
jgi:hypothetical protein